jgi:thymidylate kinase
MIYFLEGPDGGGKTTLAERLAAMTRLKITHFGYPKTEEDKAKMFVMYQDLIKSGANMIIDRCWYSDMCYGPVMRGAATITYPQMYALERLAASKGAMVIYCTDSKTALWTRATSRGEDYVTSREQFNKICDAYDELFKLPHLIPVVRYTIESVF